MIYVNSNRSTNKYWSCVTSVYILIAEAEETLVAADTNQTESTEGSVTTSEESPSNESIPDIPGTVFILQLCFLDKCFIRFCSLCIDWSRYCIICCC